MLRRASLFVAVLGLLSVGAGVASATTYNISDLGSGTLNTAQMAVDEYNGSPVVVGGGWYWTQAGGVVNLSSISALSALGTGFSATGVNSAGQIVGTYTNVNSYEKAFLYSLATGTATNLSFPGSSPSSGSIVQLGNIAENGNVAGEYQVGISPTNNPFTVNANTNSSVGITGSLGGGSGNVWGINNNGFVAAKATNTASTSDANIWNGSTWIDLGPSPAGSGYTKGSAAIALDSNNDAVGFFGVSTATSPHPFFDAYSGGTYAGMVDLGDLTGYYSTYNRGQAMGINDSGTIVGWTFAGTKAATSEYAFVSGTGAGTIEPLSYLLTGGIADFTRLSQSLAIDNAGDIVGTGLISGNTQAFLISPVATPEPSTLLLAASGLLGLLAYAWRKQK